MQEKHLNLRKKQKEMMSQENSHKEEISHLNQALYVLQHMVRKSNEIQQRIVEIFGSTTNVNPTGMCWTRV